jgi:hypothetical protein
MKNVHLTDVPLLEAAAAVDADLMVTEAVLVEETAEAVVITVEEIVTTVAEAAVAEITEEEITTDTNNDLFEKAGIKSCFFISNNIIIQIF